jgi:hypothetical protein
MKPLLLCALLVTLAKPAAAGVIYDESVSGDLSSNAAAPTSLAFAVGGNTVLGTVFNSANVSGDRDFITFTIGAGHALTALNLLGFAPDNLSFIAFNAGNTSFVPSAATNGNFLAGIHVDASLVSSDLLPLMVTSSVTTHALPAPMLPPGTYSFVIQQTSPVLETYALEFVIDAPVPALGTTWGAIKSMYR